MRASIIAVREKFVLLEVEMSTTQLLRCINCDTLSSVLEICSRKFHPGACGRCGRGTFKLESNGASQMEILP